MDPACSCRAFQAFEAAMLMGILAKGRPTSGRVYGSIPRG
jgi:hypothetical protein